MSSTSIELRFDEPTKSYCGRLLLKEGIPIRMVAYVWKVDGGWEKVFLQDIYEATGVRVRVKEGSWVSNNGHPEMDFEVVDEEGETDA